MVGLDTRRCIRLQGFTGESRCMSVNRSSGKQIQLFTDRLIVRQDTRDVHDFPQSQHARFVRNLAHLLCIQHAACMLKRGRRYARRHLHIVIDGQITGCIQHIPDACRTGNVGNLMRVGNQRRDTPAQFLHAVIARCGHGGLYVAVRVNESRTDIPPL